MADDNLITVPVAEDSMAMGRNGSREIGAVMLRLAVLPVGPDKAYLNVVTRKQGVVMNAGVAIDADAMDRLAEEWLALRRG